MDVQKIKQMTEEQLSVLLWVKALSSLKYQEDDEIKDLPFTRKIEAFYQDWEDIDEKLDRETFDNGMDMLCDIGILTKLEEEIYDITANGEKVMFALSAIDSCSDEEVHKIIKRTVSVIEIVKKCGSQILNILLTVFFS